MEKGSPREPNARGVKKMRRAARIDENQPEIVKHLQSLGMSVCQLHTVGQGVPDLMVGFRGRNILLEIKNPKQDPCKRRLTEDEGDWHTKWTGQVDVVQTKEEAERVVVLRCSQ